MDSLLSEVVPVDDESRPARPLLLAACGLTQILTLRVAVPPKTVGRKRARTVLATLVLAMFRQSKNGSRTRRFSPGPATTQTRIGLPHPDCYDRRRVWEERLASHTSRMIKLSLSSPGVGGGRIKGVGGRTSPVK